MADHNTKTDLFLLNYQAGKGMADARSARILEIQTRLYEINDESASAKLAELTDEERRLVSELSRLDPGGYMPPAVCGEGVDRWTNAYTSEVVHQTLAHVGATLKAGDMDSATDTIVGLAVEAGIPPEVFPTDDDELEALCVRHPGVFQVLSHFALLSYLGEIREDNDLRADYLHESEHICTCDHDETANDDAPVSAFGPGVPLVNSNGATLA